MVMKRILLYFALIALCGCQALSSSSTVSQSSQSSESEECPDEPAIALTVGNVREVSLNNQAIVESGRVGTRKPIGFAFEAKQGQKLSYQTDKDLCIWVYAPNNELLETTVLPKAGKYIIQVSALKGSTTFDLEMGLDGATQSSKTVPRSPTTANKSSPSSSSATASSSASLSQNDAVNLIGRWQRAKRKIFAPPYDRSLGAEFLTGEAYVKNLGGTGSVNWLQNNNGYYTYRLQEVNGVENFSASGNQATIEVITSEQRTLCLNGRPKYGENTAFDKSLVRYELTLSGGKWKIERYQGVRSIQKTGNPATSCQVVQ